MATSSLLVTLGSSLGNGRYNSSVGRGQDQAANVTQTTTDIAAVTTAIAAAAANTTISGNSTALNLVNAITTALAAVTTDVTAITAADNADVVIRFNQSTITTYQQLDKAVRAALEVAKGSLGP